MSPVEQAEVELANRNGRLHRSQRGLVLDFNFWVAAILVVAGIVALVVIPATTITTGDGGKLAGAGVLASLGPMVPILALVLWFAYVCRKRLADVRGPLVAISGWTHDFGRERATDQYPIGLHGSPSGYKTAESHSVRAGGRTYVLERRFWGRIEGERTNTVYVTSRSHILVNVVPA